jgi:uncharacterized protein YbjT (DUF2867 family)
MFHKDSIQRTPSRARGVLEFRRSRPVSAVDVRADSKNPRIRQVLVTGATGNVGGDLVRRLVDHRGIAVRALVRDPEKAAALVAPGASLARARFEDMRAVRAAVTGVDTVVLITPGDDPHAADQASTVLAAAKESGVRKIVRLSVFKAALNGPTDVTRLHGRTDGEILRSGLTYTILRPPFFMQNLLFLAARTIATQGTLCFGAGNGKLGMIDRRDVVECAERCVLSDGYDDEVLTLTGPESIGFGELADRLTAILRRPVRYVPVSPEAVEESVCAMGRTEWYGRVMRDLCFAYSQNWGDATTDSVARLTLHPPRSFDVFAHEVLLPALVVAARGWR